MATNVKVKKKKGTYDNPKLFTFITIGLAAIIILITVIAIVIYTTGNYVGYVNGKKLYDYEYEYYLYLELSKMQSEIDVEGLSDKEKTEKYREFWNTPDENGVYPEEKAKMNALEEARKFKAFYLYARKEGYKLSKEEQSNIKSNIDFTLQQWMSQYTSIGLSVSREALIRNLCGTMTLNQYKKYMIQYATIEKYKDALKETYMVSDEEIRNIYNEDRDKYRVVDIRVLFLEAVNDEGEDMTDEEYEELLKKAEEIAKSFNETGKYDDKDFKEYVKENTDEYSTDGLHRIIKESREHKSEKLNEFAYKLEKDDFNEDGITEYVVIEDKDTNGIYVVCGEKIIDLDTEEDEEDENEISGKDIKDRIIAERKEELAVEDLEKAVDNETYAVKRVRDKVMQKYVDEWDLRNQ
ncbi:MAG: hypothetical protein GX166_14505 [Clostridiaceae bacterium]|nr:hypothetical protein [Clostridiaceae bacterium]